MSTVGGSSTGIPPTITCLTIGDPHFKVNNVRMSEEMTKRVIKVAQERKPDFITVLGDILHRHETIHVEPLVRATNFLLELEKIAPTYVLIGNHDRPNNSDFLSHWHPFAAVSQWENTKIVDKVLVDTIKGCTFIWVPYVPNGRFIEALDTLYPKDETLNESEVKLKSVSEESAESEAELVIEKETPKWMNVTTIFAHQEFKGAKMGAIVSKGGDVWPIDYPFIVTGHIHDYQRPQPNILYTGTPMQHGFGDQTDKTISLLTFNTQNTGMDVTDFGYMKVAEERISLGIPKKKTVYLKPEEVIMYTPPENVELRIVIRGSAEELKSIMKTKQVEIWTEKGIKVVYKAVSTNTETTDIEPAMNYLDRLFMAVAKDQGQRAWAEKLFSAK